jgi:signal transduction histidine kinase
MIAVIIREVGMAGARDARDEFNAVASHLAARREALLQCWRDATGADPGLTNDSALSRAQFFDHIPEVLDAFERLLRAGDRDRDARATATEDQRKGAAGHGLQRWQQGYRQREAMREWRHLHLCLVDELEAFALAQPDLAAQTMATVRRLLAELCSDGVCESAARYEQLQQADAAGRVRDLERTLAEVEALELRRAETMREAAHDLRGNLGVLRNATVVLDSHAASDDVRARSIAMLHRGLATMTALLNDLISLGRLEAGQERREIRLFDAAKLLNELCLAMQPAAEVRGLALVAEGPATFAVEGDEVKTYRVAQNLLVNALKYTDRGGVKVAWQPDPDDPESRWVLCVEDTGPGFQPQASAPIKRALKTATEASQKVDERAEADGEPVPLLRSQSARQGAQETVGEGIGLSIVKRLCELLDATLELHSEANKGTTFRVRFPR